MVGVNLERGRVDHDNTENQKCQSDQYHALSGAHTPLISASNEKAAQIR
jgi:hypothetical protein